MHSSTDSTENLCLLTRLFAESLIYGMAGSVVALGSKLLFSASWMKVAYGPGTSMLPSPTHFVRHAARCAVPHAQGWTFQITPFLARIR
jgi:hypothetical protein